MPPVDPGRQRFVGCQESGAGRTVAGAALALVLVSGCQPTGLQHDIEMLPTLPQSIADTLDPATRATRLTAPNAPPEKATQSFAPCCGSSDFKTLKVAFSYTKCAPLRDFLVVSLDNAALFEAGRSAPQGGRQASVKAYRWGASDDAPAAAAIPGGGYCA